MTNEIGAVFRRHDGCAGGVARRGRPPQALLGTRMRAQMIAYYEQRQARA